jgi:uncharacterized protein involved in exopolysaccharide biosynthesis
MASDQDDPERGVPPSGSVTAEPREVHGYFVQVPLARPDDKLDLRVISRHIVRYRLMISLIIIVPVVLSAVVVNLVSPVYQAEVLLVPAGMEDTTSGLSALTNQFRGLASIAGISTPSISSKDQTIAILKSRSFTEAFIESENLLPILFASMWDSEAKQWKAVSKDEVPTIADGVELFDDDIRMVSDDASTNLVTLRIEWYDRELTARWANRLIERFNEDIRNRDIAEAQRSIEFLSRELKKSDNIESRQGIFGLLQQQIEKIMVANVREDYAFKILDPAVAADADHYVRPNKLAIIVSCGVLGLFFAILVVALRISWRAAK